MATPRYDPPEGTQRRAPDEEAPRQSSEERDRDEMPNVQLGEDPGTLEPDQE